VSWHGYFGDAGGMFGGLLGFDAQQQNANWFDRGIQNQMANAYNNQYNSALNQMSSQFVAHPAPTRIPSSGVARKADCEGCGAPLKAYIHHCEYCRRPI
jgi:hypothetical protein